MNRVLSSLILLGVFGTAEGNFYIKVDSGISFSESAHVVAPSTTWLPAIQGYDSKLGNRAIGGLSIGYEFVHSLDVAVGLSNRSTFKYRKFQTPVDGGDSYTREFDLDVTSLLFSVNLLGRDISYLSWNFGRGTIYPIIGASVGVSRLLITDFRTTGLSPSGGSSPLPSFSNENQYTRRENFTYAALAGFEYNYNDCWAIATGYRWFDAGKFKGPRFIRVAPGSAVDVAGDEWRMHFRANEWFIELKVFI